MPSHPALWQASAPAFAVGQQLEFGFMGRHGVVRELAEKSQVLRANGKAVATKRAYASDLADFRAWCGEFGRSALPASAETLCLYVAERAGKWAASTIGRHMAAIGWSHRAAELADPTKAEAVKDVLRGLRRGGRRVSHAKAAASVEELRCMVAWARGQASAKAERDAALLLFGFAGGFRRSELAALELRDVRFDRRRGVAVFVASGKTDQEAVGRVFGIARGKRRATCPVAALEAWVSERGSWPGPLFARVDRLGRVQRVGISGQAVAAVVKAAADGCGLDASAYAGHSLRAGLVTAAHEAGHGDTAIMGVTGHRSVQTLARYIRSANPFRSAISGLL